jgi:hypothetical protein
VLKMEISTALAYLTYPGKGIPSEKQHEIAGVELPKYGGLYTLLLNVFTRSEVECYIPIYFPSPGGNQQNACRNEILEFLRSPDTDTGLKLAQRLQAVTTSRSGLGLLCLIVGRSDNEKRLLISRFPADQGIIAEQKAATLEVEFVEQIFLRNVQAYKAALYTWTAEEADFWDGSATDKQINHKTRDLAAYWIGDFLLSDFRTTARAGTKRLAIALRNAVAGASSLEVKREIAAAAELVHNSDGESTTVEEFCERYQLSDATRKAIKANIKPNKLVHDRFVFNSEEFSKHLAYRTVELDSGAILTARVEDFDEAFHTRRVEDGQDQYTYLARGRPVDERLKKTK